MAIVKELLACCLRSAVDIADEGLDRKTRRHGIVMEHGVLEHLERVTAVHVTVVSSMSKVVTPETLYTRWGHMKCETGAVDQISPSSRHRPKLHDRVPRTSSMAKTYSRTLLGPCYCRGHRILVLFVHVTPASVQSAMSRGPYWLFWTTSFAEKKPDEQPLWPRPARLSFRT